MPNSIKKALYGTTSYLTDSHGFRNASEKGKQVVERKLGHGTTLLQSRVVRMEYLGEKKSQEETLSSYDSF